MRHSSSSAGHTRHGAPMGAFLVALVLAAATPASAAIEYLIDLNTNSDLPAGGPAGTWNSYVAPTNITGATIVDSTGAASPVTFNKSGTITDNTSNFGTLVFDPNQAGHVGEPAWVTNAAAGDNFYTANSATATPHTFTLSFGGLTAGSVVSIDLLASRASASAKGYFDYSVDGGATWAGFRVLNGDGTVAATDGWDTKDTQAQVFILQTQGFNLHRYLNADNVTLTGTTLDIRTTDADAATATFSAVNALRITVVPEPGMGALLVIGLAGTAMSRRR